MATSNKTLPIIIGVAALAAIAYFGISNPPGNGEVSGSVFEVWE